MNILHFGCFYYPNKGGNVVRMSHMLENNKCDNSLFVLTTSQANGFDDDLYREDTGITIIRIKSLDEAYVVLPQVVENYKIDVVVTHIIPANIIACRTVYKKVAILTEVHSLITSSPLKMLGKDILHRFFLNRRTQYYFVLSKGAEQYLIKHYGVKKNRIVFLPNGINSDFQPKRIPGNPNYFTFGYIGTFYNWQGTDCILNSVDKILSIAPSVRIVMVGGGENEDKFNKLAERYSNRLIVTGLLPKEEADKISTEIDVLMIPRPSTLETNTAIPLKIFDSLQYGKPVIMSNVFGLTEVFSENEAFIFKNEESDGLFKMCQYVYMNRDLLDVKYNNALSRLREWPSWDKIHSLQNSIYAKVQ